MRRGLVLSVCAFAALTLGVGSCAGSSASSGVSASGTTLKIYASVPSGTPGSADVLRAEQLAVRQFDQAGGSTGKYHVSFVAATAAKISDNARQAIEDPSTIAYIGELSPGTSADSLGITNAQDVLQVSPTDTALELTQKTAAVPGAPSNLYESLKTYGRTFARVVPTTAQEAKAQVQEMSSLGVKKVYVTDDGSDYGAAIALALKDDAASSLHAVEGPPTLAGVQSSGADALFFGAMSGSSASVTRLFGNAAQANRRLKLFAPSSLDNAAFAASLGPARANLYVSSPGYLPRGLPPAGKQFELAFTRAYRQVPAPAAIFGYEAVKAVLDVLREAGSSANQRATIVHDFFGIRNRNSVLGTYSINSDGDISLAPFVFSRLHAGTLVPFRFLQAQG